MASQPFCSRSNQTRSEQNRAYCPNTASFGLLQVVEKLVEQGEAVAQAMLQQLLSRLRASVQLPECLRIVGHLRRLSVFSEPVIAGPVTMCMASH